MFKLLSLKNGKKNDIYVSSNNSNVSDNNNIHNENYYTLITGENGCGKSSLLSKAVNSYIFEGENNHINCQQTPDSQARPSRVIAICNSVYNRFVSKMVYANLTKITAPYYYLQNETGTHSSKSLQSIITPALKEMVFKNISERGINEKFKNHTPDISVFRSNSHIEGIKYAFNMIGVEPLFDMDLEFNKGYIQYLQRSILNGFNDEAPLSSYVKTHHKEHIDFRNAFEIPDEFIINFLERYKLTKNKQPETKLIFDIASLSFEVKSSVLPPDVLYIAILCGIVIPAKVKVQRTDSLKWVSLQSLSSGQQSMLINALLISIFTKPNSLICIDEPENSLHPEWQLDYMKFIMGLCPSNLGCHFLIATHSPQIISGMKSTNGCVVSLSKERKKISRFEVDEHFEDGSFTSQHQELYDLTSHIRKSADRQLVDIFKSPGFHNESLVHRLVLILTKLTKKIKLNPLDSKFLDEVSTYIKKGKIDEHDAANIILEQIKSIVKLG